MKKAIICKYCDKEMILDDVDYNFKGNQDNYWLCENCYASAIEKIRYGKSVKVEFCEGNEIERKQ